MPSLRELRSKIKSIKSTQQITKAMKMVAVARLRRAQGTALAARPFAVKLEATISKLAAMERWEEVSDWHPWGIHPFLRVQETDAVGLIFVTAEKGLCGAFNANLFRAAAGWFRKEQGKRLAVFTVGRRGRDFVRRIKNLPLSVETEMVGIFPKATYAHAEILGSAVLQAYVEKRLSRVDALYGSFKSAASQPIVVKTVLPMAFTPGKAATVRASDEYQFEPDRGALLDALLTRSLKAQIYRILLESQAAELAARMNAMEAATKNAGDIIDTLTLGLNCTRQMVITREIAEIVGGAEALSQ